MPYYSELEHGLSVLEEAGNCADIIVTHCAPSSILNTLSNAYIADGLTDYLDIVRNTVSFHCWYFGHYHKDQNIAGNFSCLYNRIVEYYM